MKMQDIPNDMILDAIRATISTKLEWLRSTDFELELDEKTDEVIVKASISFSIDETDIFIENDRYNKYPYCDICGDIIFEDSAHIIFINDAEVCNTCGSKQEVKAELLQDN